MSKRKVSVIIPAYQKIATLANTLHSLELQSLPPDDFEVIVVDDCSSDDTLIFLQQVQKRFPHMHYLHLSNRSGAAAARNAGAKQALGEILIFLDADVVAAPNLVEEHLHFHTTHPMHAIIGYVYARESSPSSWPLLTYNHQNWDFSSPEHVFSRVSQEPGLADTLDTFTASVCFEIAQLPAGWAFFWTTNASIPAQAFATLGGFDETLHIKGNEDVDLGYRLHLAGYTFHYLRSARSFHQPHSRNREKELLQDRKNERRILAKIPRLEIEAICSFDIVNGNAILPYLNRWSQMEGMGNYNADLILHFTECVKRVQEGKTLLIGSGTYWPLELPLAAATDVVSTSREKLFHVRDNIQWFQLIGICLPFEDSCFDTIIITDYWRQLPERLLARLLQEALRVGKCVYLLKTSSYKYVETKEFYTAIEMYDRPFWEYAISLCRELFNFQFSYQDAFHNNEWIGSLISVSWHPSFKKSS